MIHLWIGAVGYVLLACLFGVGVYAAFSDGSTALERQCDFEIERSNTWVVDCAKTRDYRQCVKDSVYLHPLPACMRLAREVDE